jgi:hypothetical protein
MDEPVEGPPIVHVPERVDRRLRLGPFASALDALKFLTYAAVGALLAAFTSPFVWVVVAGGGFVLAVVRVDGRALDEQVLCVVRWKVRPARTGAVIPPMGAPSNSRRETLRVRGGRFVAVVRTGGAPIAYLPPVELLRRFDSFRELLRVIDGPFAFTVTSSPMRAGSVTPGALDGGRRDREACAGYSELVTLLCRRRQLRRVDVALATTAGEPDRVAALGIRVAGLTERLVALGLSTNRLRDRLLDDAVRRWGWTWEPMPS